MKKIYKYAGLHPGRSTIQIPTGARILCADNQHGKPMIWAIVNPSNAFEAREFGLVNTGDQVADNWIYIDTMIFSDGNLVQHLFEIPKENSSC